MSYASELPRDRMSNPMQNYPAARLANARYGATVAVSSVITFNDNSTTLEVGAVGGGGAVIKWISTTNTNPSVVAAGASANFDHFIPNGEVRRFVIPIERGPVQSSIVGANQANGLYNRVAWIAATTSASIFAAEY